MYPKKTFQSDTAQDYHRTWSQVMVTNVQVGGSLPATARITFNTINGVAPDLTNYSVGGTDL